MCKDEMLYCMTMHGLCVPTASIPTVHSILTPSTHSVSEGADQTRPLQLGDVPSHREDDDRHHSLPTLPPSQLHLVAVHLGGRGGEVGVPAHCQRGVARTAVDCQVGAPGWSCVCVCVCVGGGRGCRVCVCVCVCRAMVTLNAHYYAEYSISKILYRNRIRCT